MKYLNIPVDFTDFKIQNLNSYKWHELQTRNTLGRVKSLLTTWLSSLDHLVLNYVWGKGGRLEIKRFGTTRIAPITQLSSQLNFG